MNSSARLHNSLRALLTGVVSAVFLWTLLLSASPQLHTRIHPDANAADHSCAVTLIATGSYDHVAQPPLVGPANLIGQFGSAPALTSAWVQPLFFSTHIFAHAPPAHS